MSNTNSSLKSAKDTAWLGLPALLGPSSAQEAARLLLALKTRPSPKEMGLLAEPWRPWRSHRAHEAQGPALEHGRRSGVQGR